MKTKFQLKSVPILIAIIMALLSSELFAQEKIDYTQLRGKEWVMELPDELKVFMSYSYTVDTCIAVAKHLKKSVELKYKYYLSDDWNGTFDDTKVGVWGAGKYLITKIGNKEKIEKKVRKVILINVYEILKLTETELEWRSVEHIRLTEGVEESRRQGNNTIVKFRSKEE